MPALKPTDFFGEILWLGRVPVDGQNLRSGAVQSLELSFEGALGERHSGITRPSCARVTAQHPRGTQIANVRQLSILSREELDAISAEMGLDGLAPEWMGASIILRGLPSLTWLPPSSRLQAPDGATLVIDMENRACSLPAREIEREHPGFGAKFKPAAKGRRGVTSWVERPGRIGIGQSFRLHIPNQPVWPNLDEARAD